MHNREPSIDVSQVNDSKKGGALLQKKTLHLRKALKEIAQKNRKFEPLLKYVASQVGGVAIEEVTGFYFLFKKFDEYSSGLEIHQDIEALHHQWEKECKIIKNNILFESGQLLIDIYRCYFLQAFCNKILPALSASSPIEAVEAKEFPPNFMKHVESGVVKLKEEKLTATDSFVKQWIDQPFLSLNNFMDQKTILIELKKFNEEVEIHRKKVMMTLSELKAVSNFSTTESVIKTERDLSDLEKRIKKLGLDEETLSSTRVQLETRIKTLSDSYFSTLQLNEKNHISQLPTILEQENYDFSSELNQSNEFKRLDKVLEKTKEKELKKKKYFEVKTESVTLKIHLDSLRQRVIDFNIQYNDIAKEGQEIDIVVKQMTNAITILLDERKKEELDGLNELEKLIQKQEVEFKPTKDFYEKLERSCHEEKTRLCEQAKGVLINQLEPEAKRLREKCYKEHHAQIKKIIELSEVEIKGVEDLNQDYPAVLETFNKRKQESLSAELEEYRKKFNNIKAGQGRENKKELGEIQALSHEELKHPDLKQKNLSALLSQLKENIKLCSLKQIELNNFLTSLTSWCEIWDGSEGRNNEETKANTLVEISKIPPEIKKFHKEVKDYLEKVNNQLNTLKASAFKYDLQLHASIFESKIKEIQNKRKEQTTDRYAADFIEFRELRNQIIQYKEAKDQENKAMVDEELHSIDQLLDRALKTAIKNHAEIWNANLSLPFKSYEAEIDTQILQIISTQLIQDKKNVPLLSFDAKTTEHKVELTSFNALIKLGEAIDKDMLLKEEAISHKMLEEELAEAPKQKIAELYGSLRKKTADVAFYIKGNYNKITMPCMVEPEWSTCKFVVGLVLGLIGGICYWCSYQSRKAQYEREKASWPRSVQTAAYQQANGRRISSSGTTGLAYGPIVRSQSSLRQGNNHAGHPADSPPPSFAPRVVMLPHGGPVVGSIAESHITKEKELTTPLLDKEEDNRRSIEAHLNQLSRRCG